jgi:hypothetical protein
MIYLFNLAYRPSAMMAMETNRNKYKYKNKHIGKLQIMNQKQINGKQIPPPSAVGITHSRDEAPLVRK